MKKQKQKISNPPAAKVAGLPSREEVMAFVASASGKVGKREIAKAFGIGGGQRIWLKRMLREMEDERLISRRGKSLGKKGEMPAVFTADITGRDADGELLAEPVDWDPERGAMPRILVLTARKTGERPAGVGDRVLLRIDREPREEGEGPRGRIVKVLPKGKASAIGVFRALPDGGGRLVSIDKKGQAREIDISEKDRGEAEDGDLVSVSLNRASRFGETRAKVRERLGSLKSERAVSLIAIHAHDIPHVFPAAVLADAEAAKPMRLAGREDWRKLPLLTIDPADARDHDDAVHACPDDDPSNPGGHILTVAIADVAAYVTPGSPLDQEALKRGNSVYFPDRVVPMLPERISNDLCSLRPQEDRPALAVRIVIDANGLKRSHAFHRIMMRSAAKLAYEQAQAAIDGRPDETTGPLLEPVLRPLWTAYAALVRARTERGPLDLDLPERKIVLKEDGSVDRVLVPERLDAHRLIEECMILANVCAAETLEKAGSPLLFRVHDEPSLEKMRILGEVLASVGVKLPKGGVLRAEIFNRILKAVAQSEHQAFVNEVVLRSQSQAMYDSENYGHFGLNLRRYAHFTSPIRRYADLVVHRALIRALQLGKDGLPEGTGVGHLKEIGEQISNAERRAMAAERETIDRLIAHFLADQIGATFHGRIAGVTKAGLFVKLDTTGADGFVPASTIGADYYAFDEGSHSLRGQRTGETYRLGDRVEVKLVEAAPVAGALRFELVSEGRRTKAPPRGRTRRAPRPAAAADERGRRARR